MYLAMFMLGLNIFFSKFLDFRSLNFDTLNIGFFMWQDSYTNITISLIPNMEFENIAMKNDIFFNNLDMK